MLNKYIIDNFIDYVHEIKKIQDSSTCFEVEYNDNFFIYYNKKTFFGREEVKTLFLSYRRDKKGEYSKPEYMMIGRASKLIEQLNSIKKPNKLKEIKEKLIKEFPNNDDFSMGVRHALSELSI